MPMSPRLLRPRASGRYLLNSDAMGAIAAYSLRRLSSTYTGPAVRIRRSNDNAEADFTPEEIANGTLTAWVGAGNNGLVRTMHDQTGNGNHLQQTTAANQMVLVSSGSLVTENNRAAVQQTTGTLQCLRSPFGPTTNNDFSVCCVASLSNLWVCNAFFDVGRIAATAPNAWGQRVTRSTTEVVNASPQVNLFTTNRALALGQYLTFGGIFRSTSTGVHGSNGSSLNTVALTSTTFRSGDAGFFTLSQTATFQELVLFNNDATAKRAGIERDMNSYYNIHPTYADADVNAYIHAVEIADGQKLETGVRDAINDFIVGCKADGIWTAIKASCILMGARTLSGALTPLVGTAPTNNNFVSGDYNRKTGLVGNRSTKFINTNRANNADPQDSNHNAVYVSAVGTNDATANVLIGSAGVPTVSGVNAILHNTPAGVFSRNRNSSGGSFNPIQIPTAGFFGTRRSSSSSHSMRASASSVNITDVSQAPDSNNVVIFRRNDSSSPGYSDARIAFYSVGESLTLTTLESRITTLYTAIGAAIP